jgi:hypothetical protein
MALPSRDNLTSLDFVYLGQPFVRVEAKDLSSQNLDIVYLGQPFVGAAASTPPITSTSNVYTNVNGTWKQASQVYVNVSGVWKDVVSDKLYVNVGASWKS